MKVFWEAFGNGSTFSAGQIMHFIAVLTGKKPHRGGKAIVGDVQAVDPTTTRRGVHGDHQARRSSGATGSRARSSRFGDLAFCSQRGTSNKTWKDIGTSYFADPWIIIAVTSAERTTPTCSLRRRRDPHAVGRGMTFFQNHARHEIGHAVGAGRSAT